jgi:hypothetical protein
VFLVNARDAKHVPNGCSGSIRLDYCGPAFDPKDRLRCCDPTCVSASVFLSTRPRTSSICRRR